jgi:hypothetical protein
VQETVIRQSLDAQKNELNRIHRSLTLGIDFVARRSINNAD